MKQDDYIEGLSILLCLDINAKKDLKKLKTDTLEQMFCSYKENALRSQRRLEEEIEKANKQRTSTCSNTCSSRAKRRVGSSN